MSDEEHHFESKADASDSKTYPQQASTIHKNDYIVIKGRPYKVKFLLQTLLDFCSIIDCIPLLRSTLFAPNFFVVEVSTSKIGKHDHAKCHFVGIDIFTTKKLEDIVPSSHNCDLSLLTKNGNTKDDLKLPTDESLLTQIKDGFVEGKDLVVSVMSAIGEEQTCALKDIGPKN
ncbi:Eukaryotic translation initiation factor 5A-2 [Glycine max]|nr:Eukaryotic translation initiation factor 5A-2 [Glycine max]